MSRRFLLAAAALLLPAALQAQATATPIDSLALGRQYTQWFYTGMADSLIAHMPAEDRAQMTTEQILNQLDMLTARAGNELEVIEEKFIKRNGHTQYWRTAKFDNMSEPLLLRWVILPGGEIGGIGMGPLSQAPPIDPAN